VIKEEEDKNEKVCPSLNKSFENKTNEESVSNSEKINIPRKEFTIIKTELKIAS
jgi:hypothetical protein